MSISYRTDDAVTLEEFLAVLERSGLASRRPVDDVACIRGMLAHSNLVVTARDGDRLVGIARSVTDFHYCCYLSDLAVDRAYQRDGIGLELQRRTRARLGSRCTLILLSAPAAMAYYPRIGYTASDRCFTIAADEPLGPEDRSHDDVVERGPGGGRDVR